MLNRTTSSVIAATSFGAMAITPSHPDSLLFVFISNNKVVATVRLALALFMLAISFDLIRISRSARKPLLNTGLALIVFGFLSMIISPVLYSLYDYLKVLDIMIVMELGIILTGLALVPQPNRIKTDRAKKTAKPRTVLREA